MQKYREIQYAVFENCGKPSILGNFDHFGSNFGQKWHKISNFRVFLKKQKGHFFTLPKTSIHGKNQGNPMCGFLEKRLRARQRGEVFNGPNSPVGRRTKNYSMGVYMDEFD